MRHALRQAQGITQCPDLTRTINFDYLLNNLERVDLIDNLHVVV
jgi:hypothetical protein